MLFIYVLRCDKGKYYVGKTFSPKTRIRDHFNGCGSYWTSFYKPVEILKVYPNCDNYDEDKYTIKMMDRYGIDNVRGGSFTSLTLSPSEKGIIVKMIDSANNNCFACGSFEHFQNTCKDGTICTILKLLQKEIIRCCRQFDSRNFGNIDIDTYVLVLLQSDGKIFKNMTSGTLKKILRISNNTVDYLKSTFELIKILNKVV